MYSSQHNSTMSFSKSSNGTTSKRGVLKNITNQHGAVPHKSSNLKSSSTQGQYKKKASNPFFPHVFAKPTTTIHEGGDRYVRSDTLPIVKASREKTFAPLTLAATTSTKPKFDIDQGNEDDPLYSTEYVSGIYQMPPKTGLRFSIPTYMKEQSQVTDGMRAILVDWLLEVHHSAHLATDTLYLTVNIVDRFLAADTNVDRRELQLVGTVSLFIASKYEDIYGLGLRDLVVLCDNTYKRQAFLDMEQRILETLGYQVTIPTANKFLVRFLKAAGADANDKMTHASNCILDGTLFSCSLLEYLPSQLAAAAVMIANRATGRPSWSDALTHHTGYKRMDVLPVAQAVHHEMRNRPGDLRAIGLKYSHVRNGSVALWLLK